MQYISELELNCDCYVCPYNHTTNSNNGPLLITLIPSANTQSVLTTLAQLNRALAEAIRTVPPDQLDRASDALLAYQAAHPLAPADPIRWLGMPRKYTRKSVRFTLPINTYDLRTITPFEYVSRHVWLSDYRKELCRCVFVKYQPPASSASAVTGEGGNETTTNSATGNATTTNTNSSDNNAGPVGNRNNDDGAAAAAMAADENASTAAPVLVERTLDCTADLDAALGEVLGFYGTPERIVEIRAMLCLDVEHQQPQTQLPQKEQAQMVARMNFRSWCGVVAFGERFLNRLSRTQDPCDEVCVPSLFGVNVFTLCGWFSLDVSLCGGAHEADERRCGRQQICTLCMFVCVLLIDAFV